jgi:hypothetical protein
MSGSLLPPAGELARLTDDQARSVILAVDRANGREHSYALTAMICGTLSLLAAIAGFVFLVTHGHTPAAGVLLGTAVLTVIGQIIGSRLRH